MQASSGQFLETKLSYLALKINGDKICESPIPKALIQGQKLDLRHKQKRTRSKEQKERTKTGNNKK